MREVVLAVARNHSDVLADPAPEVIFAELGESSLNFELRVWTIQQVQTPARLKSDLYFALFEAFRKSRPSRSRSRSAIFISDRFRNLWPRLWFPGREPQWLDGLDKSGRLCAFDIIAPIYL